MADDILASQNATLAASILQAQQKNQAALVPELFSPQIVVGQDANAWVGGSSRPDDAKARI